MAEGKPKWGPRDPEKYKRDLEADPENNGGSIGYVDEEGKQIGVDVRNTRMFASPGKTMKSMYGNKE